MLSGVNENVHRTLDNASIKDLVGSENICSHISKAVRMANKIVQEIGNK